MSDAEGYTLPRPLQTETLELKEFFGEIFEKNQTPIKGSVWRKL
jgi:hypothetical protein